MKILFFCILILLIGCNVQYTKLSGEFFYNTSETNIKLTLNNDSTFSIRSNKLGVINLCQGQVYNYGKNKFQLVCNYDENKPKELLKSNFYKYEEMGSVINSNTLKIGNKIFRKNTKY